MTKEEKQIRTIISNEIDKCNLHIYPNVCEIRDSKVGVEKIQTLTLNLIKETGMSVKSALAQVDSSL
jgi:hypothetical protein